LINFLKTTINGRGHLGPDRMVPPINVKALIVAILSENFFFAYKQITFAQLVL
jgi:hypothetical protein